MVNYKWKFSDFRTMTVNGNDNTVVKLNWALEGSDGMFGASHVGTINLDTTNVQNFIEFNDLTQEIVEGWAIASIGDDMIASFKTLVENRIQELNLQSQATTKSAPWVPNPVMTPSEVEPPIGNLAPPPEQLP